jgi:RNA-binding protein YlmH
MKLKVDIDMIQISYQSLTKSINEKMILGNTVTAGVSEVVFYATIEWE